MQDNFFTIIIPNSRNKAPLTVKVSKRVFIGVASAAALSAVIVISSVLYSSYLTRKAVSYERLKAKTHAQGLEIEKMSTKAQTLEEKINKLLSKEESIRKTLGIEKDRTAPSGNGSKRLHNGLMDRFNLLGQELRHTEQSFEHLSKTITQMRQRIAFIPSIWPTRGRIMSTFGYRISPWRGLHTGVDINTAYGSPVKSAADGKIEFVGWRNGYGKTIIVNHGFGIETLYGHLSGFACKAGQKTAKGKLIGYVGTTGFTTGPHLHYEVIKKGVKIDPMVYLDLKLSGIRPVR